ncbi:unnamed protein product [Dibothriocephalus latus]|uniref:Uncharacterized protein n=1 Tax=Dibothriocephalus latus TaxID=60516 RepID=A0A3P7LZ58_DIBLA|nr:unnamed protein product [Dibothriocephalus latus]
MSFIPIFFFSVTPGFACFSNSERRKCAGSEAYEDVVQKLVDPITEAKDLFLNPWTTFEMSIIAAKVRPECRTVQNKALFSEVWCSIQTIGVDILIQRMAKRTPLLDSPTYGAEYVEISIPGAVLNARLEEALLQKTSYWKQVVRLAELNIQNISSIIEAHKLSIPKVELSAWKSRTLKNTGRLLQKAVLQRRVEHCQWLSYFF